MNFDIGYFLLSVALAGTLSMPWCAWLILRSPSFKHWHSAAKRANALQAYVLELEEAHRKLSAKHEALQSKCHKCPYNQLSPVDTTQPRSSHD